MKGRSDSKMKGEDQKSQPNIYTMIVAVMWCDL